MEYSCSECGIYFNPETESTSCPACGSEEIFPREEEKVLEINSKVVFLKRKSRKSHASNPKSTNQNFSSSKKTEFKCHDCGGVFVSHDSESICPYCNSGYIINNRDIRDIKKIYSTKKASSELIKKPLSNIYFLTMVFIIPILFLTYILENFSLFFGINICVLVCSMIFVIIKEQSTLNNKFDLLVIRNHAAIWASPDKKKSNIVTIVHQGFQINEKNARTVGDTLWHDVDYKGRTCSILSSDVLNLRGLLMFDIFIIGEKQNVHIYKTPSTKSSIVKTLPRGFYVYKRSSYPRYFTEDHSSIYWGIAFKDYKWIEIYKGITKTGYVLKNDFFLFSMTLGVKL